MKLLCMSNLFRYLPVEDALEKLASAGYTRVELVSAHHLEYMEDLEENSRRARKALDAAGLTAPNFYAGRPKGARTMDELLDGYARAFDAAKEIGATMCVFGPPTKEPRFYQQLAALCEKTGMRCGFENHPQTPQEMAALVRDLPDIVGLVLDSGWFSAYGYNPLELLDLCPERVIGIHLKDVRQSGTPEHGIHIPCRLGEGVCNLEKLMERLVSMDYKGTISVENEPGRNIEVINHRTEIKEIRYPEEEILREARLAREWAVEHGAQP